MKLLPVLTFALLLFPAPAQEVTGPAATVAVRPEATQASEVISGVYVGIGMVPHQLGLRIDRLVEGSPADEAGLVIGDVILAWGNRRLRDDAGVVSLLNEMVPGDQIPLKVMRDGAVRSVVARLGRRAEAAEVTEVAAATDSTAETVDAAAPAASDAVEAVARSVTAAAGAVGEVGREVEAVAASSGLRATLDKASESGKPVLAVFGAKWSSSSKAFARTLREPEVVAALEAYEWVILDTDENKDAADKYGVSGLPHLVVLRDGKRVSDRQGYMPPQDAVDFLAAHSGAAAAAPAPAVQGLAARDGTGLQASQPNPMASRIGGAGGNRTVVALENRDVLTQVNERVSNLEAHMVELDRQRTEQVQILRKELAAIRALLERIQ